MFEVGGFGRAAGAGSITGDVSAYGQISGKYKKLNAPDPHLWTYDYDGSYFKANISDVDISHLDLEEFGGQVGRGANRRANNAIILTPHLNLFRDSLRSSQLTFLSSHLWT